MRLFALRGANTVTANEPDPILGATDELMRELMARNELAPDAIVEDNVVAFPALAGSGRPWVRIVSCNPAELKDQAVPPVFSGYGEGDRAAWPAFREAYRRTHADLWAGFAEFVRASRGGTLADGHRCAGEPLADAILRSFASGVLREHTWELPPQDLTLRPAGLTPLPADGLRIRFRRV